MRGEISIGKQNISYIYTHAQTPYILHCTAILVQQSVADNFDQTSLQNPPVRDISKFLNAHLVCMQIFAYLSSQHTQTPKCDKYFNFVALLTLEFERILVVAV